MSALLHIGEADHKLLNADAEIKAVTMGAGNASLCRALDMMSEARAALGAVRFALRTQALFDALDYHEDVQARTRFAATERRDLPGRGLHRLADQHEAFAKALRTLVGTTEFTADNADGADRKGVIV